MFEAFYKKRSVSEDVQYRSKVRYQSRLVSRETSVSSLETRVSPQETRHSSLETRLSSRENH